VDVGVELHVDRVGELHAERVGERAGREQAAAGHGDDDLRVEVGVGDGLRELTGCGAEQLPGQHLLLDEIGGIGVVGLGHRVTAPVGGRRGVLRS
jgi:hypothetical protein